MAQVKTVECILGCLLMTLTSLTFHSFPLSFINYRRQNGQTNQLNDVDRLLLDGCFLDDCRSCAITVSGRLQQRISVYYQLPRLQESARFQKHRTVGHCSRIRQTVVLLRAIHRPTGSRGHWFRWNVMIVFIFHETCTRHMSSLFAATQELIVVD